MSGDLHTSGRITVNPPITWAELSPHRWATGVEVLDDRVDTADGVLHRRTGVAIVGTHGDGNGYDLLAHVQAIVDAFATAPDGTSRVFGGHLECAWAHGEDVWRIYIRDGRAVTVRPTWPDEPTHQPGGLRPVPMTQDDVGRVLYDMADRVAAGDSYEGHIEYLMPTDVDGPVPDGTYAMVRGAYRVGNRAGQGGMRNIGRYADEGAGDGT